MDDTPQGRENHTNTLSEHHVRSAMETVLATRVQTYEEFMDAFVVLTPADVANFSAQRGQAEGDRIPSLPSEGASSLFEASPRAVNTTSGSPAEADGCHGNQRQEEEEELEIEELGDDLVNNEKIQSSEGTPRALKYIQVDNYLDEPDSDSEFLSDLDGELDFDDSSSKYIASFDGSEKTEEDRTAKLPAPIRVTPELIKRATDESDLHASINDPEAAATATSTTVPPFPGPYPGEVDNGEGKAATPQPATPLGNQHQQHITQLPHSARLPLPSDIPIAVREEQGDNEAVQDVVEPFSIDPDFDYDNVILTPKWPLGEGPPFGP